MIKYHPGKFYNEYKSHFSDEKLKLKFKEQYESCTWKNIQQTDDEGNFSVQLPEKMAIEFGNMCATLSNKINNLTVVDVGAAEGLYSIIPLHHFSKLQVVAFEPDIIRAKVFQRNLYEYKELYNQYDWDKDIQFDLFDCIVSDGKDECVTLRHYECEKTGGGAGSSTTVKVNRPNRKSIDIKCETINLDNMIGFCEKVDILKIDVEGGEVDVLRGAENFIQTYKPIIFLEVHLGPKFGNVDPQEVFSLIEACKIEYKIKQIGNPISLGNEDGLVYFILIPSFLFKNPPSMEEENK